MPSLEQMTWEERALAAEKTVTVLKRRVHDLQNGSRKTRFDQQLEAKRWREEATKNAAE
jgi:hypothetical protein